MALYYTPRVFVGSTSLIYATLSFSINRSVTTFGEPTYTSGSGFNVGLLRLEPRFSLPTVAFSFVVRFAYASLRSL